MFDPADGYMVSSDAKVTLLGGKLMVHQGQLVVPLFNSGGDIQLLDTNLAHLESSNSTLQSLLNLSGFDIGGTLTVTLVKYESDVGASLTLPSYFAPATSSSAVGYAAADTGAVSSSLTAVADNQDGLVLWR